jgi:hypothetical protein
MAAPLWTQADVDSLKTAVASGVLTVSYSGPPARTVTYQNAAEMWALLARVRDEVLHDSNQKTRYRWGSTRKGL